jgi:hypothetical protein
MFIIFLALDAIVLTFVWAVLLWLMVSLLSMGEGESCLAQSLNSPLLLALGLLSLTIHCAASDHPFAPSRDIVLSPNQFCIQDGCCSITGATFLGRKTSNCFGCRRLRHQGGCARR